MKKKTAKALGFDRGYNIGHNTPILPIGTIMSNENIDLELQSMMDEIKNEEDQRDIFYAYAGYAEENNREFSPFEFTTSRINNKKNSEELWEAFDNGIEEGFIVAYREKREKEDATKGE